MCQVTAGNRTVTDVVYAAPIAGVDAILGLDTLRELGLELSIGGVNVVSGACAPLSVALLLNGFAASTRQVMCLCPRDLKLWYLVSLTVGQGSTSCQLVDQLSARCAKSDCLFVARTLVPAGKCCCVVRVMNTTDVSRHVKHGEVLAEAEEVSVVNDAPIEDRTARRLSRLVSSCEM